MPFNGEEMEMMSVRYGRNISIFKEVEDELMKVRNKFPSNKYMLTAFNEEVGELNQAFMEHSRGHPAFVNESIRNEAIQVICMAVRLITEGDDNFIYQPH